jgi:hypothetical protein
MLKNIAALAIVVTAATTAQAASPIHAQDPATQPHSDSIKATCRRVGVMAMYFVDCRDRGISHKHVIDLLNSPAAPPEPPWAKGLLEGVADAIWANPGISPSEAVTMGYMGCIDFMTRMEKASDQEQRHSVGASDGR